MVRFQSSLSTVNLRHYVEALDPYHLLTTGEEGFYTAGSIGSIAANPELWALTTAGRVQVEGPQVDPVV